ncbi:translation initiation factor IF-2 [Rhinolophus ferrumequinum]|uniref:translation initiation factor IF-2 n=1 Tax=Rhinolophus ferrumequinum TaxID=59479 RepID=UPI00140FF93A|nr:translation initiation factor IF-2 [Rhinolophus ferrumequinum]
MRCTPSRGPSARRRRAAYRELQTRRRVTLVTASRPSLIGPNRRGRTRGETQRLLPALSPVSRAGAKQRAGQPGRRLCEEAARASRRRRRVGPATCGAKRAAPGLRRGAASTAPRELTRPVHRSPGGPHVLPAPPGLVISRRGGPRRCIRASASRCRRLGCRCSPASPPPTPGARSKRRRGRCILATALCNLRGPVHAQRGARAAAGACNPNGDDPPPNPGRTGGLQAAGGRSSERKQQRPAAAGAGERGCGRRAPGAGGEGAPGSGAGRAAALSGTPRGGAAPPAGRSEHRPQVRMRRLSARAARVPGGRDPR